MMDDYSYKKLLVYLENFRKNYKYFALTYSGKYAALYLDQFIIDQVKMAQAVYGDKAAKKVKDLAAELSCRKVLAHSN